MSVVGVYMGIMEGRDEGETLQNLTKLDSMNKNLVFTVPSSIRPREYRVKLAFDRY